MKNFSVFRLAITFAGLVYFLSVGNTLFSFVCAFFLVFSYVAYKKEHENDNN